MRSSETNQLQKVVGFLASISDKLIEDLKNVIAGDLGLIKADYKDQIAFVDFGINEDGYTLFLHPMDAENNQLGYKKLLLDYPNGILREKGLALDVEDYDFDDEDDMDRMDDYYMALKSEFIKWFSSCWDKARGQNAIYKFYITSHDDDRSFDLKRKEWIDHVE